MSHTIAQAEELVKSFLKGKEVHDIFAAQMNEKLIINGQKLEFWREHFKIEIPYDNLNPAICRDLDLRLLKLNQEAALYFAIANARVQCMERGNTSLYRQRFNAIVQEYKSRNEKLPANATLELMAKSENDEVDSANSLFEVEKMFWRDILDHLASIRKILENVTWNNKADVEIKYAKNFGSGE
jgi:hypothetical protein